MNHDTTGSERERIGGGGGSSEADASIPVLLALTRGGLLARNTLWGLVGQAVPMAVAVVAMPFLVDHLGKERFGLLFLAWGVIGYFSVLNMGLGRAMTQHVAERIGTQEEGGIPGIVTACLGIMFALGSMGTLIVWWLSPFFVQVFQVAPALRSEALRGFYVIALTIPVVIVAAGAVGVLQAYQRFRAINTVRMCVAPLSWLAPLTVSFFSADYALVVGSIACVRVVSCGIYLVLCIRPLRRLGSFWRFEVRRLAAVLRFAAWLMVSSVIGSLLLFGDRFFIGAWLSPVAVTYYMTPYEVVMKLLAFSMIVSGVLFPAFSTSYGRHSERTAHLLARGCKYLMMVLFPIMLSVIVFARMGLGVWMGSDFAAQSTGVLQWLGVGVFAGSVGLVFYGVLQGAGRPDLTAKIHLLEAVPYVVALWFLLGKYGIVGAAVVWTGRILVELPVLFWLAGRLLRGHTQQLARLGIALTLCLAVLLLAIVLGFKGGVALLLAVLAVFAPATWLYFLDGAERLFLIDCVGRVLRSRK